MLIHGSARCIRDIGSQHAVTVETRPPRVTGQSGCRYVVRQNHGEGGALAGLRFHPDFTSKQTDTLVDTSQAQAPPHRCRVESDAVVGNPQLDAVGLVVAADDLQARDGRHPLAPPDLRVEVIGVGGAVVGADQPQGRVAVVFALQEQADGGTGRYGSGPGAQAAVPSLPAG